MPVSTASGQLPSTTAGGVCGVVIILSMVDERIAHTRFYLDAVS
jgi:hypothetical protein